MSIYIVAKAGYIIKAFASSSFTVRVEAFLFIAVNLPDIVAKSNFKG
jgi:hypothetical protein